MSDATSHSVAGPTITSPSVPSADLRIDTIIAAELVTTAWKRAIYLMIGNVNSATFRGWERHELRFLGARLRRTTGADWRVTYLWKASVNQAFNFTEVYGSGENPGPVELTKEGHQYLWFTHATLPEDDGATKEIIQSVHLATLYPIEIDFSQALGLAAE